MRPWLVSAFLVALSGCTLYAGQPWGEADVALEAAFAPGADRLTDDGRLRTSTDYALALDEIAITLDAVRVTARAEAQGAAAFDPSSPPPGYTLCHAGHCHAEDGRLVPYAEIEAELGGASEEGSSVVLPVESGLVTLTSKPSPVPLGACAESCWLDRGALGALEVMASRLIVSGVAFDLREGERRRLPEEGVPFEADLELSTAIERALEGELERGQPVVVDIDATLFVAPSLFDDVPFAALYEEAGPQAAPLDLAPAAEAVKERLSVDSELSATLTRREPPRGDLILLPEHDS